MPIQMPAVFEDVTLQVRVWPAAEPSRPPVVLLPATAETAEDWDAVAEALSPSRTVHAVNLRGHGPSDWPGTYSIDLMAADVIALLEGIGQPIDLVGHSLGGLVACKVAAARPELVHKLALEDVGLLHPRPAAPPAKPEGDLPFDWRVVEQVRPEIDDPELGWSTVMTAISATTLVVAGGPRSSVPQEHVAELVRLLPEGRLVTIDAGHLVHATSPDEFNRHLLGFLE